MTRCPVPPASVNGDANLHGLVVILSNASDLSADGWVKLGRFLDKAGFVLKGLVSIAEDGSVPAAAMEAWPECRVVSESRWESALGTASRLARETAPTSLLFLDATLRLGPDALVNLLHGFRITGERGIVGGLMDAGTGQSVWVRSGYRWQSSSLIWEAIEFMDHGNSSLELEPVDCPNLEVALFPAAAIQAIAETDSRLLPGQSFADVCQRVRAAGFPLYAIPSARFSRSATQISLALEQDAYSHAAARLSWARRGTWRRYPQAVWRIAGDIHGSQRLLWLRLDWRSPRSVYWALAGHARYLVGRLCETNNHARFAALRDYLSPFGKRGG